MLILLENYNRVIQFIIDSVAYGTAAYMADGEFTVFGYALCILLGLPLIFVLVKIIKKILGGGYA